MSIRTEDIDDALIEVQDYANKLEADFDKNFYANRLAPPKPSLKNFGAQVMVLREVLTQMQGDQQQPGAAPPGATQQPAG